MAGSTDQTEMQDDDRPRVATTPGNSLLDNLRYLAFKTVAKARNDRLAECEQLVRLVCDRLAIPLVLGRAERVALLERVLHDVTSHQRRRAVNAGAPAIAVGAVMTQLGPDSRPFEVAAAGELLGLIDDEQLSKVRRTLGVTDEHWNILRSKERHAKRIRQLRAGLWLGELQNRDYASKRARDRETELLNGFGYALEADLRDSPVRASLLAFAATIGDRESVTPGSQASIGDRDVQTQLPQPARQPGPTVTGGDSQDEGEVDVTSPRSESPLSIWMQLIRSYRSGGEAASLTKAELLHKLGNSYRASKRPVTEAEFYKVFALFAIVLTILALLAWAALRHAG